MERLTMKRKLPLLSFLLSVTISAGLAQSASPDITADDLRVHVRYLASDELEGRASGSAGNRKAAEYIAAELNRYGVKPAGTDGGYVQPFSFVSAVKLGSGNALTIERSNQPAQVLQPDVDFRPLGFSSSATITGQLVFAGYGISAPDKGYDDYRAIEANGKVVVILRYGPDGDSPRSEFVRYTSLREKARMARDKGAAGILLVTGPMNDSEDDLLKLAFDQVAGNSGIPIVTVKRSFISPLLTSGGRDLRTLQDSIKASRAPQSFPIEGAGVSLTTDVQTVTAKTANIIGVLEGNDDALKGEVLVLGAHMDHLGYGGPNSGSTRPDTIAIHNGADDNASGTAALLELAQKFGTTKNQLKRTIVFTFFSAEELGTLGSVYYVNHPSFPLTQTVAMLNMDMVGRLENRSLTVGGSGTSPAWNALLSKYNADSSFTLTLEPDGFGPSDHASFYGKNIPVLFFFTGTHADYHKPSDDWNRINYSGEEKITRYIYSVARDVAGQTERPLYARVESSASRSSAGDTRSFSVTLGIVPDFGQSSEGMKVSAVQPNRPAEKAGLKAGDIIIRMAGKKTLNIYDYMGVLGELKPGDEVQVEVLRDGKPMTFTAKMEKRK
jgi:aminopeptidase YwaD